VLHVIFSTKDRQKTISPELQPQLWAYVAGVCKKLEILVHAVGGIEDHIHLLIQVPPSLSVAKAILTIKSNSSRWANEQGRKFAWQQGYRAFSVSSSNIPAVVQYIRNQQEHHKKRGFEEEFVALLKKHGVTFDPKFVFG
jgi:REP element-mobilizing transposase RayT